MTSYGVFTLMRSASWIYQYAIKTNRVGRVGISKGERIAGGLTRGDTYPVGQVGRGLDGVVVAIDAANAKLEFIGGRPRDSGKRSRRQRRRWQRNNFLREGQIGRSRREPAELDRAQEPRLRRGGNDDLIVRSRLAASSD